MTKINAALTVRLVVRFLGIVPWIASHLESLFDISMGLLELASPSGRTPENWSSVGLDILKLLCMVAAESTFAPPPSAGGRLRRLPIPWTVACLARSAVLLLLASFRTPTRTLAIAAPLLATRDTRFGFELPMPVSFEPEHLVVQRPL